MTIISSKWLRFFAVMLLLQGSTTADQAVEVDVVDKKSMILEKCGLMLKSTGLVATFSDINVISVVADLNKPIFVMPDYVSDAKIIMDTSKRLGSTKNGSLEDCVFMWVEEVDVLEREMEEEENEIIGILEAFIGVHDDNTDVDVSTNNSRAGKRSIAGSIMKGVTNDILSTVPLGDTKSYEKHLLGLKDNVNEFMGDLSDEFRTDQIRFNAKIIGIERTYGTAINLIEAKEWCLVDLAMFADRKYRDIDKYVKKLRDILHYQLSGQAQGSLTPGLIPIQDLKDITGHHLSFKNTIFEKMPHLLYKHSLLGLHRIQFTGGTVRTHFLLSFPLVYEADRYMGYKVYQTGFKVPGATSCSCLRMSETVMKKPSSTELYDMTGCAEQDSFGLCRQPAEGIPKSCLELKMVSQCHVKLIPCRTYNFQEDSSGVLVTAMGPIRMLETGGRIVQMEQPYGEPVFLSWNKTSTLILGEMYIQAPTVVEEHQSIDMTLVYSTEINETLFGPDIDTNRITHRLVKLLEHQNKTEKTLQDLMNSINEGKPSEWFQARNSWKVYSLAGLVGIGVICTIVYCACRR